MDNNHRNAQTKTSPQEADSTSPHITVQPRGTPLPPLPPTLQRRRGIGGKIMLIALAMIIAAAAGYAGGYVASLRRQAVVYVEQEPSQNFAEEDSVRIPSAQPPVFEEAYPAPPSDFTFSSGLASSPADYIMTVPEVAAAARQTVVEIKTETLNSSVWVGSYISEGAGSGVIISEDGYIITNHHVISGASTIAVRLVDGREFPATLIATDQKTDIAIIKIDATGLQAAVFGNSSALVIGESAIAIGNPLGELGGTVTGGMISALDREMIVEGEAMTLLQTDAAVNPGNSGGGLFNMRAELIGIVNAKSNGLNIEGLGFAIPSNIAKTVASDLLAYGYVKGRTETGLDLLDIQTSQAVRWYRVDKPGLYILNSVDEQFKNGDRISDIEGIPIANLYDYNEAMKAFAVGDTVTITVSRGNDSISGKILLTEWKP